MKKTMVFTLILMPLIVLAVLLFSGNIVNRTTYLYVESIEFVDEEITLQKDNDEDEVSFTLKVNIFPLLASNKDVEFWSDDPDIVSIDQNGKIVAVNYGSTYVYVKSKEDATKFDFIKVTVTSDTIRRLWLEETHKDLYVGDTYILDVKYLPVDAIDTTLEFLSSNQDVAIVDTMGKIDVRGSGDAVITVRLKSNPSLNAQFTVSARPRVSSISIADSTSIFSAKTQFTFPEITLYPSGASEPIKFAVSDDDVASVDRAGNITFKKEGTVTVRAYIKDTDYKVEKIYTSTYGKFASLSFLQDSPTDIKYNEYVGRSIALKYTYTPADADPSKLIVSSSNTNVIGCDEDGVLTVLLGGKSKITLTGDCFTGGTISASSTININRTSDLISFTGDRFNPNEEDDFMHFAYFEPNKGEDCLPLDAKSLPKDANDLIHYSLIDENGDEITDSKIAYISSDNLYFGITTKEAKYLKVKVRAWTDSGVKCEVIVTYIDIEEKIDVGKANNSTISRNMPLTGGGEYSFALVDYTSTDFTDISFTIVEGDGVVSRKSATSPIFTLREKGIAKIRVDYYDEEGNIIEAKTKTIEINVNRLVEEITSLKVTTNYDDIDSDEIITITDNNNSFNVYSSAKKFTIGYSFKPLNTTLSSAEFSIVEESSTGIASIEGNVITFNGIGYVKVKITADNAERYVIITSTFMHPDDKTTLKNIPECGYLTINKGERVDNLFDYIDISPEIIDRNYITFSISGNEKSISLNNRAVKALCGNTTSSLAVVSVAIDLGGGNTKNLEIKVHVKESATGTKVTGSQQFWTSEETFDLSGLFEISSPTANTNLDISYVVESGLATISGKTLKFTSAGIVTVKAVVKGDNDTVGKITVVYLGSNTAIANSSITVIKGTTIVIKPSDEAIRNATYEQVFEVVGGADISINGIYIVINSSGSLVFGEDTFTITCLEQLDSDNLSLTPIDSSKFDITDGKYVTADSSIQMEWSYDGELAGEYITNGYASAKYLTNAKDISQTGLVTFESASEWVVTLEISYVDGVIGAKSISIKQKITTTMGAGELKTSKTSGELNFSEENKSSNYVNIAEFLSISPKPLTVNTSTVSLAIASGTDVARVSESDPLSVEFVRGGTFEVCVTNKTNGDSFNITFKVNRHATGVTISHDSNTYSYYDGGGEDTVITGNRATIYVNPVYYPSDANVGTTITWKLKDGYGNIATVPSSKDRVVFEKANEEVVLEFTVGEGETAKTITVKYMSTDVMFEIDLDALTNEDTIIVTQEEDFTFTSKVFDIANIVIERADKTQITSENGTFEINTSFNEFVTISDGNNNASLKMIVVSNMQNIDGFTLNDVDMNGSKVEPISTKKKHITASKELTINANPLSGVGADGVNLTYVYRVSSSDVATISNLGEIEFKKAGKVTVIISVTYKTIKTDETSAVSLDENSFEDKILTWTFEVESSYGMITDFSMATTDYTFDFDEKKDEIIDILTGNIERKAPVYGIVSESHKPQINITSGTCVKLNDSDSLKLDIIGSGNAKLSIILDNAKIEGVNIKVNKKIETITALENETDKEIYRVVVQGTPHSTSSYSFTYRISAVVTPNLLDKISGSVTTSDNSGSLKLSVSKVDTSSLTGEVTLSGMNVNNKYTVTISDGEGGAVKTLEIVIVESDVQKIDLSVKETSEKVFSKGIILASGKTYIFEDRYNSSLLEIESDNSELNINGLSVFGADHGTGGTIVMKNGKTSEINFVVTEDISSFSVTSNWNDGLKTTDDEIITAMGDAEHGISLSEKYTVSFLPTTAGTYKEVDGKYVWQAYEIGYSITGDGANINGNLLYFTVRNSTITINIYTTDNLPEHKFSQKITSTLGYATGVVLNKDSDFIKKYYKEATKDLEFEYGTNYDEDLIFNTSLNGSIYKLVAPIDAYKLDTEILSLCTENESVAKIEEIENGKKLTLVGGGETTLKLRYNGSETDTSLYVINRASGISIEYDDKPTYHLVTDKSNNEQIDLSCEIINKTGASLSDYKIKWSSNNEVVATVENGKVTFTGTAGTVTIKVSILSIRNSDDIIDKEDEIVIYNNANYNIIDSKSSSSEELSKKVNLEDTKTSIIFPKSEEKEYNSFEFSFTNNGIIESISENGEITWTGDKGGYVTISVTAYYESSQTFSSGTIFGAGSEDILPASETGVSVATNKHFDSLTYVLFVRKKASNNTIILGKDKIYTAKTSMTINQSTTGSEDESIKIILTINNDDGAMVGKNLTFKSSDESIATVTKSQDGNSAKIVFSQKGEVNITVSVDYINDEGKTETEISKTVTIRSSFGEAESFELYDSNGNKLNSGEAINIKTKDKNKLAFTVKNILPSDCDITPQITNNNSGYYTCTVIENNAQTREFTLELKATKKIENGALQIGVTGSPVIELKVNVEQLAESVVVNFDGKHMTNTISLFNNTISLGLEYLETITNGKKIKTKTSEISKTNLKNILTCLLDNNPSNTVSNQTIIWEIVEGNAEFKAVDGVWAIVINEKDTLIKIKATSGDGECFEEVTFKQVSDITGFSVTHSYKAATINGKEHILLSVENLTNNTQVSVTISVSGIEGFNNWNYFKLSSKNGCTLNSCGSGQLIINLPAGASAEFFDEVTIKYKNTSLYDGEEITKTIYIYRDGISSVKFYNKNYSDSESASVELNETATQNAGKQQMLVFGNKSFYVENNAGADQSYYYMRVMVTDINGSENTSLSGFKWVAKDKDGNNLSISLTNGWAKIPTSAVSTISVDNMYNDNFNNTTTVSLCNLAGVVLQTYTFHFVSGVNVWNITGYNGTSQSAVVLHGDIAVDDSAKDQARTTIYGNGKWLDLSARNSTKDSYYQDNECVSRALNYAINVNIKGNSKTDGSIVQLTNIVKFAYSEFLYLYRIFENNNAYIKRCLLHGFQYAGLFAWEKSAPNFYLEDLIMYDVGPRGIEIQAGTAYVKGFLDVYNYQNKSMAAKAFGDILGNINSLGNAIISMAKNYKTNKNNDDWVNMIGISTKGADRKMLFWNGSGYTDYETSLTDKECPNSDGIYRIIKEKMLLFYNVTAWTVKKDEHPRMKWSNQYNSDGSLNTTYLNAQAEKLKRLS